MAVLRLEACQQLTWGKSSQVAQLLWPELTVTSHLEDFTSLNTASITAALAAETRTEVGMGRGEPSGLPSTSVNPSLEL
jgi:hypothetical protein